MPYAITFTDAPGITREKKSAVRQTHLDYVLRNAHRIAASGGLFPEDDDFPNGGLILLEADTRQEAVDYIENELSDEDLKELGLNYVVVDICGTSYTKRESDELVERLIRVGVRYHIARRDRLALVSDHAADGAVGPGVRLEPVDLFTNVGRQAPDFVKVVHVI